MSLPLVLTTPIKPRSAAAELAARQRLDSLVKPLGALGRLEDIAAWLAGAQDRCPPSPVERVRVVIFAGDHGVADEGVSAYPREVTAAMVAAFLGGVAGVSVLARAHGAAVRVLDLGGGFPWPWATSDVPADLSGLRAELERVDTLRRFTADAELWFESGRYLVSSCGTLLATVLDVKVFGAGKTHVILDTGMIHLGGMAGLGRIHRPVASIDPLSEAGSETLEPTDVMGPTDSPLDCIARGALVPPLRPGDTVAMPNVGAYGLTASLVAFASRQPPAEVCCRGISVVAAYRLRTGHKRIST